MEQKQRSELICAAFAAREFSYAPYSRFKVGAALLTKSGKVYTGCNIECATFSPTNCAERTALFKAVSEGERTFTAIAVVGSKEGVPDDSAVTSPCGVCRQMLYEFAGSDLTVIMAKSEKVYREMTLGDLLPLGFGPEKIVKTTDCTEKKKAESL